jgi:transposase
VSIGNKNSDKSFQISHTIAQIRLIESQLNDSENHLKKLWGDIDTVLKTIPGIGVIDGAMIYSEIGDITRFRKPDQLIAFAGLDPATVQSGKFRAESTRMSKRGSPFLSYALVNAAWNVSMNNATFGEYYNLKLSEKDVFTNHTSPPQFSCPPKNNGTNGKNQQYHQLSSG